MLSSLALGVILAGGSVIDLDATIFVQLGIFFVAFFILKSLVFAPVLDLFAEREKSMGGARQEAARLEEEAAEKRAHFEGELRKVRAAASEEREKQRAEAQKLARELMDKSRRDAVASQKAAKDQLDREVGTVRDQALKQVPMLAQQIVQKLLGRSAS